MRTIMTAGKLFFRVIDNSLVYRLVVYDVKQIRVILIKILQVGFWLESNSGSLNGFILNELLQEVFAICPTI